MTTPLTPGQMRLHNNALPQLRPTGADRQFYIDVGLDVQGSTGTIATVALSRIRYDLVDPGATSLSAADVLAVYPPADAEDATDVMLPHIALRSRTLPWANGLPSGAEGLPWVALLLFADNEATYQTNNGRRVALVPHSTLEKILPTPSERELLCHVRQLPTDDPVVARDDDAFVAIVIGNRLPVPNQTNRACLVDLRNLVGTVDPAFMHELPILYEWSFKVSDGGDFEAYFARLRTPTAYGTGGVVAFGSAIDGQLIANDDGELELAAPTVAKPDRIANYAGPCVPLPRELAGENVFVADEALAVRNDGREIVTYSAAFELGRLLALSNPTVLEGLTYFRNHQFYRKLDVLLDAQLTDIPSGQPAFRGSWKDIFHDIWGGPWMPNTIDTLWNRGADPTGLRSLVGRIPGLDKGQVLQLAQIGGTFFDQALNKINMNPVAQPTTSPATGAPDLGSIDWFGGGTVDILDTALPELRATLVAFHVNQEGLP